MCEIIFVPKGKTFPKDALEAAYYTNEDGVGTMYAAGGRVVVDKNPKPKFEDVAGLFAAHQGRQFAMHLRFATHGLENMANTHPYMVLDYDQDGTDLYLMHNGVIGNVPADDRTKSDTWHFVHKFLRPVLVRNPRLIYDEKFQGVLGSIIGSGNKLLLMDGSGRTVFINRKQGNEHESGCWISNTYSISNAKIYRSRHITDEAKERLGIAKAATHEYHGTYGYDSGYDTTAHRGTGTYKPPVTLSPGGISVLTRAQMTALGEIDKPYPDQKVASDFCPMLIRNLEERSLVGNYTYMNTTRLWVTAKGRSSMEAARRSHTFITDFGEEKAIADWVEAKKLASRLRDGSVTDLSAVKVTTGGAVVPIDAARQPPTSSLEEINSNIKAATCDDMCQVHGKQEELEVLMLEDVLALDRSELVERIKADPEGIADLLYDEAMDAFVGEADDDEIEAHHARQNALN